MKTSVSVLGCCMSRNIFNAPQLLNTVEVKNFAFQIIPYTCFDTELEIPVEQFRKIGASAFEQKILNQNLNKTALKEFEKYKTDYIVIDLVACCFSMYQVYLDGKSTVARLWNGDKYLNALKKVQWFQERGFLYKRFNYKQLPEDKVYQSLSKLAKWLQKNYKAEQIIVCMPKFPKKWLNNNLQICEFNDQKQKQYREDEEYIVKLTNYLIKNLDDIRIYQYPDNMIAREWGTKEPLPFHQTNIDYIRQGENMIKLLNLTVNDINGLDPISYMLETWVNKYYRARKKLIDTENALLNRNKKDSFDDSAMATVFIQSFGKNLLKVSELEQELEYLQYQKERIWCEKYLKLRDDYIKLEEKILGKKITDEIEKQKIDEIRDMEYNHGLENVESLIQK